MFSIFISYLSTICAFLLNVLSSFRFTSRISATPDSDIELCVGAVEVVEVVEVHVLEEGRVNALPKVADIIYCPAYANAADIATVQEAFLPSKLAEAMERYSTCVADKLEQSYNRDSVISTETDTSGDNFFSEGQSIASSVTSLDESDVEEYKDEEVVDIVQEIVVKEVLDEDEEDEESIDETLDYYSSFSEEGEDEMEDSEDEHYFSFSEDENEEFKEEVKDLVEEVKYKEIQSEEDNGLGVEEFEKKDEETDSTSAPKTEVCSKETAVEFGETVIPIPLSADFEKRSSFLRTLPDVSLDIEAPKPPRPVRDSKEEDLTDVLEFMERCKFELPAPPVQPMRTSREKRPKLVPSLIVQAPFADTIIPLRPRLIRGVDGKLAGVFGAKNDLSRKIPRLVQFPVPEIEVDEPGPRIVVHSPSSDAIPPRPSRPYRDVDEDLTGVFEFMEEYDFELPVRPFGPEPGFGPIIIVQSPSGSVVLPSESLQLLDESNDDDALDTFELTDRELPSLSFRPFPEIEPVPSVVVQSPSLEEIPTRPTRPTREASEDLTGLLNFMNHYDCELPSSGIGANGLCEQEQPDVYLDFSLADQIDFSGGNNRMDLLNPEDEWEPIFDIIDNFGIPFEEGQAFFMRAMEWFEGGRVQSGRELKSSWSEESVSSLGDSDAEVRGEDGESELGMREQGPVRNLPFARIPPKIQVAPQDYLQVPKRGFRRI